MDCSENNTGHAQYPALSLSHDGSWTHAAPAGLEKAHVSSGLYGGPGGSRWSVGARYTGWGVDHSFWGEQAARETQKHKRAAHPHLTPHIPMARWVESRGFQPGPCRTGFKAAVCVCKRDLRHSICQSKAELCSSVWTPHPVLPTRWLVHARCSWQGPFSLPGQWPKHWENKQRVNDFVFTLPAFRCQHLNLILGFLPRRYGSMTQAYSTPLSTPSDWTCFLSQKFCNGCWKRQLCTGHRMCGPGTLRQAPGSQPRGTSGPVPFDWQSWAWQSKAPLLQWACLVRVRVGPTRGKVRGQKNVFLGRGLPACLPWGQSLSGLPGRPDRQRSPVTLS